ncbi:MAG: hypothetical protein JNK60_04535 [Acidobacteria bacterium]|nr:hypothetical protein [Acidobacteriota bacterium]
MRQRLEAAASLLAREEKATRQLAGRARSAALDGRRGRRLFTVVAVLVLLPTALATLAAGGLLLGQEVPSYSLFAFACLPLAATALTLVFTGRFVSASHEALATASAAQAPDRPGEPARCRVCGAPLESGSPGIARCGFCAADNVVTPAALARTVHLSIADLARLEADVLAAARAVGSAAKRASLALVLSGVLAPVVAVGVTVGVALALAAVPVGISETNRYALVATPLGPCVARVTAYRDHVRLSYGGEKGLAPEDRPDGSGLSPLDAGTLVGKTVRLAGNPADTGRVVKVTGTLLGTDAVVVERPGGGTFTHEPAGLCFPVNP